MTTGAEAAAEPVDGQPQWLTERLDEGRWQPIELPPGSIPTGDDWPEQTDAPAAAAERVATALADIGYRLVFDIRAAHDDAGKPIIMALAWSADEDHMLVSRWDAEGRECLGSARWWQEEYNLHSAVFADLIGLSCADICAGPGDEFVLHMTHSNCAEWIVGHCSGDAGQGQWVAQAYVGGSLTAGKMPLGGILTVSRKCIHAEAALSAPPELYETAVQELWKFPLRRSVYVWDGVRFSYLGATPDVEGAQRTPDFVEHSFGNCASQVDGWTEEDAAELLEKVRSGSYHRLLSPAIAETGTDDRPSGSALQQFSGLPRR